ncbi:MAG: ABC transporter substrate-binding protein [Firmicutes bacterium]|nr:ABC transporter substrate-binding protein [Bacillota bacterium]
MKTHLRVRLVALCLAAIMLLALAGVAVAREKVTFWTSHSGKVDREALELIATKFNESQTKYEVEVTIVPGSETDVAKLMTAVAAGTGPDVYLVDRFTTAQRAVAGALTDLTPFIERAGWKPQDDYLEFAIEESTWAGKIYSLPFDTDTRGLYYRKADFREAGLDPELPPATIEELDQAAAKLTKRITDRRFERFGLIPWLGQGWHYTWGWAFGGEFYDHATRQLTCNHPAIVEAFAWQQAFAEEYSIAAIQGFASAFGSEAQDPFIAGKISMIIDGDWKIAGLQRFGPDVEYGVGNIPVKAGVGPTTWAGGWAMAVPRGAKSPDGGFEFARFAAGPVGQEIYTRDTVHLPTLKTMVDRTDLFADSMHDIFLQMLPFARSRPALPVGALLWDELTSARDYAINGDKTPQKALDDVVERVQEELEKHF